ncbi:hypothetical protein K431DRAFT_281348 [Polychaeton citri CBS 116435]|uniref:Oxidase ustYa n=1 Tax=Polychaeton citri CBS 116435 TaxID=1314669 RepID=A0A9P4UQT2_9PEZI|nr:hypothetical protein K431DRAFT_281348 [Polychaeton citri CBS 116435]
MMLPPASPVLTKLATEMDTAASNKEAFDSLPNLPEPYSHRRHIWRRLSITLLVLFVGTTACFLALRLSVSSRSSLSQPWSLPGLDDELGNPPNPFLTVQDSLHTKTFVNRQEFQDTGNMGDILWERLLPSNGGFVIRRLEDGTVDQENSGAVTVFHQLHCLNAIRMTLKMLNATVQGDMKKGDVRLAGHDHVWHCLDYVAQGVTCRADWTLERLNSPTGTDGWGVMHQCQDFEGFKAHGEARGIWDQFTSPESEGGDDGRRDHTHVH